MIVFDLSCGQGHRFEGWFDSGEEFARQSQAQMVRCPVCDTAEVARLPSAKVRAGGRERAPAEPEGGQPAAQQAIAGLPAALVAKLREVVRNTENVGRRFPEEARRIHYDETPVRAIRGQATREESEALVEEGISFSSLPDFLLQDVH
jgi:hypothetical protein